MRYIYILSVIVTLSGCTTDSSIGFSGHYISEHNAPISLQVLEGEYDSTPKFLQGKAPVYPTPMADKGIRSGTASLAYTITKDGRAIGARVIEASHPQFAAGVAHVMPTWRFAPATQNGVPVEVVAKTSIHFELRGI